MDLAALLLLALAIVAALLVPPYVVGRLRMTKARSMIAHEPHLAAGFGLVSGGARPILIYLGVVVGVAVIGIVLTIVLAIRVEPLVAGREGFVIFQLLVFSPPIILAVVLIGMLISLAATGRARSRYLDQLAQQPDLSEQSRASVTAAAEQLSGGRSLLGVAGTAAIAAIACLALGLGWIALLFSVAGGAIQCARSAKCL